MVCMDVRIEITDSVAALDAAAWDALTDGSPMLSHRFLSTFESTRCVGDGTGWQPCPLTVYDGEQLIGAMPLYAKYHSYGEYVFDWAWARAFAEHGLEYYPKLIAAIPYTPISGARLLCRQPAIGQLMLQALTERLPQLQLSSLHVLFPDEASASWLAAANWLRRDGVQFRWENRGYASFAEFLATLTHAKRKKIRQERKKVQAAGITCRQLQGASISADDWRFFYGCYANTYRQHHSLPYLNLEFFIELGRSMPDNLLLILAYQAEQPIAAALNLHGTDHHGVSQLYGRYWGALQYVPGLHFELCYYQAQEFCIAHGIRYFEGGAQGEHKLARGFEPRSTCSYHHIANPDFARAIERAVRMETRDVQHYRSELEERAPFRREADTTD